MLYIEAPRIVGSNLLREAEDQRRISSALVCTRWFANVCKIGRALRTKLHEDLPAAQLGLSIKDVTVALLVASDLRMPFQLRV